MLKMLGEYKKMCIMVVSLCDNTTNIAIIPAIPKTIQYLALSIIFRHSSILSITCTNTYSNQSTCMKIDGLLDCSDCTH